MNIQFSQDVTAACASSFCIIFHVCSSKTLQTINGLENLAWDTFFHSDSASWRAERKVHVNEKEYAEEAALLTTHRAADHQPV